MSRKSNKILDDIIEKEVQQVGRRRTRIAHVKKDASSQGKVVVPLSQSEELLPVTNQEADQNSTSTQTTGSQTSPQSMNQSINENQSINVESMRIQPATSREERNKALVDSRSPSSSTVQNSTSNSQENQEDEGFHDNGSSSSNSPISGIVDLNNNITPNGDENNNVIGAATIQLPDPDNKLNLICRIPLRRIKLTEKMKKDIQQSKSSENKGSKESTEEVMETQLNDDQIISEEDSSEKCESQQPSKSKKRQRQSKSETARKRKTTEEDIEKTSLPKHSTRKRRHETFKNNMARYRSAKHSTQETNSTVKRISRSTRADVLFPVGRIHRNLRHQLVRHKLGKTTPVYLAAVLEYLTRELLLMAGDLTKKYKKKRITPKYLEVAARFDYDYAKLWETVTIPECGAGGLSRILANIKSFKKFETSKVDDGGERINE